MKILFFIAVLFLGTSMMQAQNIEPELLDFDCSFWASFNQENQAAFLDKYLADTIHIDQKGKKAQGAQNIVDRRVQEFQHHGVAQLKRQDSSTQSNKKDTYVAEGSYERYVPMDLFDLDLYSDLKNGDTVVIEGEHWKITKTVSNAPLQNNPNVGKTSISANH